MSAQGTCEVVARFERGELRCDEACRVLVQGVWLVVGVPFEVVREQWDDAGRRGLGGFYLTPKLDGGVPVLYGTLGRRKFSRKACVHLSWSAGVAFAEVDPDDELRLDLEPPEPAR